MTPYSRNHEITAWGKRRSVAAWAEDIRCAVMLGTLRKRLREGWDPEEAVTTPRRQGYMLAAFGETKSLAAWGRDPRATGGTKTLL